MKILELNQMEVFKGGVNCSKAEGILAGITATAWVLGPIGYGLAWGAAMAYWTTQCGPGDY